MLRRNNIFPTQEHRNLGGEGGGGGGSYDGGGNRNNAGNHAEGANMSTGGMAGTEELKAVLELGMRDSVRRLLKQVERGPRWQHMILHELQIERFTIIAKDPQARNPLFSAAVRHCQWF